MFKGVQRYKNISYLCGSMSGIYIHIPFCAQRCIYCDFYSTVDGQGEVAYIKAVLKELECRKQELELDFEGNTPRRKSGPDPIQTLYLGGGTPSQLSGSSLRLLFEGLEKQLDLSHLKECTMECNPDDITPEYIQTLQALPINRLSLGVQSFEDNHLKFLRRRHSAQEAKDVVRQLQQAGFSNISLDLMYALPKQTLEEWNHTLDTILSLGVQHISAYSLMYEGNTPLVKLFNSGQIRAMSEENSVACYTMLIEKLTKAGYEHYEISNFALPGYESRHNSSYWQEVNYLGLGAAAHSFDGRSIRRWNMADKRAYIQKINETGTCFEKEILSLDERYNERIMKGLRTSRGVNLSNIEQDFGSTRLNYLLSQAQRNLEAGLLVQAESNLRLSAQGIYVSDAVMSDLMYV